MTARRAGKHADGLITVGAPVDKLAGLLEKFDRGAREAGRDPDSITICVAAPAYVGDDLAHAREQAQQEAQTALDNAPGGR